MTKAWSRVGDGDGDGAALALLDKRCPGFGKLCRLVLLHAVLSSKATVIVVVAGVRGTAFLRKDIR